MIFSRSSEYAIRACIRLAGIPEGKCLMVKEIAEKERIPEHFLAKILQDLARKGLLRSAKGPSGGFCLNAPAGQVKLLHIVKAVDGTGAYERCIAGRPTCTDAAPCPMHGDWVRLRSRIMRYLERGSIKELSRAAATAHLPTARARRPVASRRAASRV